MIHSPGVDLEMRRELPATLRAAEEFIEDFRRQSETLLARADRFEAELLIREALTNAVVHGCRVDPDKQVRCSLRLKDRRLLIAVEDDGNGFDWRAACCAPASPSDCRGRGLEILRKYSNGVRYNDRGNAMTIIKCLS
jgi:anti-sigma regulatory factor (Ser/Thr protein kinase)